MVSGHSEALCVATLKSVREAAGLLSPAFLKEKKKKKSKSTMGFKLCRGDSYHLVRLKWGNAHILRFYLQKQSDEGMGIPWWPGD